MLRFNDYGYLPPGDHPMTFSQLRESVLVLGEEWISGWNESWRRQLVDHLEMLVLQLWQVGIEEIVVNGSFCSTKPEPDDLDAYYVLPLPEEILSIQDDRKKKKAVADVIYSFTETLNQFSEIPIWNVWEMSRPDRYGKLKSEMYHHYRIEMFPSCWGVYTGHLRPDGQKMKFDEFFRKDRYGIPKGVVKIVKG